MCHREWREKPHQRKYSIVRIESLHDTLMITLLCFESNRSTTGSALIMSEAELSTQPLFLSRLSRNLGMSHDETRAQPSMQLGRHEFL